MYFELKPSRGAQTWEKEIEKIFDVFSANNTQSFTPTCEILDEEKSYSISLDIPGISQDDLEIEVKDNHLHISGERKVRKKENPESTLRSEKRYGKFSRVFSLPQNVNSEGIVALVQDGVLEVSLPKEEKSLSKKIPISRVKPAVSTELKN